MHALVVMENRRSQWDCQVAEQGLTISSCPISPPPHPSLAASKIEYGLSGLSLPSHRIWSLMASSPTLFSSGWATFTPNPSHISSQKVAVTRAATAAAGSKLHTCFVVDQPADSPSYSTNVRQRQLLVMHYTLLPRQVWVFFSFSPYSRYFFKIHFGVPGLNGGKCCFPPSVISPFQPQTPPLLSCRRQELDVRPHCTGHRIGRLHLTQVSGGHPPKPARSLVASLFLWSCAARPPIGYGPSLFQPLDATQSHWAPSLPVAFFRCFSFHLYSSPNDEFFFTGFVRFLFRTV